MFLLRYPKVLSSFIIMYFITVLLPKSLAWPDWRDGDRCKWAKNCDFEGHDLYSRQVRVYKCNEICADDGRCTHFTWTRDNNGICWLKQGYNLLAKHSNESSFCGYVVRDVDGGSFNQERELGKKKDEWMQNLRLDGLKKNISLQMSQQQNSSSRFQQSQHLAPPSGKLCNTRGCKLAAAALITNIDERADPCTDFYEYACGKWSDNNPMSDDQVAYTSFILAAGRVQHALKSLLESDEPMSIGNSKAVNVARQFYRSCMDLDKLSSQKSAPLYAALKQLGNWPLLSDVWNEETFDFSNLLAASQSKFFENPFFQAYVSAHVKDSRKNVLHLGLPSLSLGARDYYLNDTDYGHYIKAHRKMLRSTISLIAKDAGLAIKAKNIAKSVDESIEFERKLAKITPSDEDLHGANDSYHVWTVTELKQRLNFLNWNTYLGALLPNDVRRLINNNTQIVVTVPSYFQGLAELLASTEPRQVANFDFTRLAVSFTSILDQRFLDVNQAYSKVINGQETQETKWKTCISDTLDWFDQTTGALYVDKYFNDTDRQEVIKMIKKLRMSFRSMIGAVPWLDQTTKAAAINKLNKILPKIGYPERAKSVSLLDAPYKEIELAPSHGYFDLFLKIKKFHNQNSYWQLLEPVELVFQMSPLVVSAYYIRETNSIVIPAAILQPPFFHRDYPASVNFGAIGTTIGHEITHGFDDEGSQYDADGNLNNWWSETSWNDFRNRTQCVVNQYSSYVAEEVKMNLKGETTQGENIADNGGVKAAFKAYKNFVAKNGEQPLLPRMSKSNEQVFFLSYAQKWCASRKPQRLIDIILTDGHSPERFRVNGPLSNFDEFSKAFSCKPGSSMNPLKTGKTKCEVW